MTHHCGRHAEPSRDTVVESPIGSLHHYGVVPRDYGTAPFSLRAHAQITTRVTTVPGLGALRLGPVFEFPFSPGSCSKALRPALRVRKSSPAQGRIDYGIHHGRAQAMADER
jgi:hypothetical protein